MHGVRSQVDPHAELVFHQPEVFIAGPKQGLKVWRDFQSDLQRNRQPPARHSLRVCFVDVIRQRPNSAVPGAAINTPSTTSATYVNFRGPVREAPKHTSAAG